VALGGLVTDDLHERGARVLSVFGPFGSRTLVEMPTEVAQELFPDGLGLSGRMDVIEAAERDIAVIGEKDEALARSALAASAVAMAYEVANPFNSATSKSMCQARLVDALDRLRALAPAVDEGGDEVDRKRRARAARLARQSAAGSPPSS
jgi:hypothetical protein